MKRKMIHEIIFFSCLFLILIVGMNLYSCKEKELSFSETPTAITISGDNSFLGAIYVNSSNISIKGDKLDVKYFEIAFSDVGGLEEYQQKTAPIQVKLYKQTDEGEEEVWLKEKMGENNTTLYYAQNFESTGDLRVEATFSYVTNNQKAEIVIEKAGVELAQ